MGDALLLFNISRPQRLTELSNVTQMASRTLAGNSRYIRKTDEAPAAYAVLDAEARVVERIYEMYTVEGRSIGEITRRINAEGIPTRKASARWERSTVWAVLRNSAYRGVACFGKTRASSRTRVIRPQRRRGVITPSMTAGHERPREE